MAPPNKHAVGARGADIVILIPPTRLSRDDALAFAAWIVAIADPAGDDFAKKLAEICA